MPDPITPIDALNATKGAIQSLVIQIGDKFGQIDTSTVASVNTAIAALESQLLGGADTDNDTLKKLSDRITAVNNTIAALDATYATDAELAATIQAINEAWMTADGDLTALVASKIDAVQAQAIVDAAIADMASGTDVATQVQSAKDHSDAQLVAALQGLTAAFNAGATHIATL